MPSVEELLSQTSEEVEAYADTGIEYCTVDDDTRLVTIPDKYKKLGVESDEKAKRIWFRFPKLVGNNGVDLSAIGVRVKFRNANGEGDIYIVEDLTTDGDYVTFSWELTRKVTAYKGNVSFVVCAVKSNTDGMTKNEWNTTLNKECEVLEGLEVTEQIEQENPDIIEYILANLGGSVSAEQIAQAVEEYLVKNPPFGMTADEKAQMNKNTEDISQLSEDISQLSEEIADLQTSLEPMDGDIPKVFLTGDEFSDMTTDKNEVNMEMEYRSRTKQFHAYILIKFQGRSSLSKPKKNFTIKMYSDDTRESKLKMAFKDWGFEKHKYVLKANFIDHTHARNIIGANLWSEVVASRSDYDTLPEELRTSPRNGAIDGFPIKLYVNGTYQGIYTWNIGKDDWMWGMDEDNPNHVLLCAENNTDGVYGENACNFRKIWNGVDGTRYSIEVGTNSDSLVTSVNNLITFVMSNNGDSFKTGIGNYLDVQSAIDYYIHQYVICGLDGLAQNMLLGTYDGVIWRCGAYDMDSTFGLWWTGAKFVSTDYKCPEDYQEKFSLLWERFEENFWSEIQTRYSELRKTVYSVSNMFTVCERFTDIIGSELYVEDLEVYPDIPQGSTSNIKQLRNFIRDRLAYCDEQILNGIPAVSITLNKTSLTLDGRAETLTATVLPSDTTDDILWITSDSSVATVNNGVVTPVSTGTCTIRAKCGSGWAICEVTASITTEPDEPDEPEVSYTNLVPTSIDTDGSIYNGIGYKDNCRLSSSGAVKAQESASVTGFMPYTHGSIVRAKTKGNGTLSGSSDYFQIYNEDFTLLNSNTLNSFNNTSYGSYVVNEDGSDLITINTSTLTSAQGGKWCRFSRHACKGADIIITANEEIV